MSYRRVEIGLCLCHAILQLVGTTLRRSRLREILLLAFGTSLSNELKTNEGTLVFCIFISHTPSLSLFFRIDFFLSTTPYVLDCRWKVEIASCLFLITNKSCSFFNYPKSKNSKKAAQMPQLKELCGSCLLGLKLNFNLKDKPSIKDKDLITKLI